MPGIARTAAPEDRLTIRSSAPVGRCLRRKPVSHTGMTVFSVNAWRRSGAAISRARPAGATAALLTRPTRSDPRSARRAPNSAARAAARGHTGGTEGLVPIRGAPEIGGPPSAPAHLPAALQQFAGHGGAD